MPEVSVSVIVATWCRPGSVRSCLEHLFAGDPPPHEVIVVDASPDRRTSAVVAAFPEVRLLPFPRGARHMTSSRNAGLLQATGDIVAFVDDDANVRLGWLNGLVEAFADSRVGAVAGRTCNGHRGEERNGAHEIGRVLPTGRLTGNFAADPGSVIEVDHGIGANMAFRREVLGHLGGFRDDFRGIGGVREDTDVFLRVKALGYRIVFTPVAIVDHLGAPHVRGRRFDYRYQFWARHNHALLLARNYGLGSREFARWVRSEIGQVLKERHPKWSHRLFRSSVGVSAVIAGLATSVRKAGWSPTDPKRRDELGTSLQRALTDHE